MALDLPKGIARAIEEWPALPAEWTVAEARRAEGERCAQIADNDAALGRADLDDPPLAPLAGARILAAERIAAAIRAR